MSEYTIALLILAIFRIFLVGVGLSVMYLGYLLSCRAYDRFEDRQPNGSVAALRSQEESFVPSPGVWFVLAGMLLIVLVIFGGLGISMEEVEKLSNLTKARLSDSQRMGTSPSPPPPAPSKNALPSE